MNEICLGEMSKEQEALSRKREEQEKETGTYPQDVHLTSLELSCPWAPSSLYRRKEMET